MIICVVVPVSCVHGVQHEQPNEDPSKLDDVVKVQRRRRHSPRQVLVTLNLILSTTIQVQFSFVASQQK